MVALSGRDPVITAAPAPAARLLQSLGTFGLPTRPKTPSDPSAFSGFSDSATQGVTVQVPERSRRRRLPFAIPTSDHQNTQHHRVAMTG